MSRKRNKSAELSEVKRFGTVTECLRLNIREQPSMASRSVAVVDVNSILAIDLDNSNSEWYAVCTPSNVAGYAMKDFVSLMPPSMEV